jgi:hypothetical protein
LSGAPSLTTSATTNSPAGSYTITNTVGTLSATNYTFIFTNGTLAVNQAALIITASNRSKAYGQTVVFAGTEFSTSGLLNSDTVTGASLSSPGAVAGAAVNGSPYNIMVTNAVGTGLTNYTISYVNGQLTVTPVTLTVTANSTNRIYGAANPAFTASYNGFVNGDTVSVLSGSPSLTTVATVGSPVAGYTITAANGTLSATNYSFNFVNGTLTVNPAALTVTANNTNRLYGATNPVFTASYSGFVNGDTVGVLSGSPSLTTAATAASPAAGYTITATNGTLNAANYAFNYVNGMLTVSPAALTVSANNLSRPYFSTNPPLTVSYFGFVNGDTTNVLSGSPGILSTSAKTNSPVGTYVITNTPGTLSAVNYAISYTNGILTVTPVALTVTVSNMSRVYGATNPVLTVASYTGFVNGDTTSVISGAPSLATTATVASPVGNYAITATNGTLSAANYSFSFVNGTLMVTQAVLTVWANDAVRGYGAVNPVFSAIYLGFVNGDTTNVLGGAPGLTTVATTASPVAFYTITAAQGTLSATNYSFNFFINGTMTVTQAVLTVTANNKSRAYGKVNPALTVNYSGFMNGDTAGVLSGSPSLTTSATTNSPAGNYDISTGLGTLSAANYSFNLVDGTLTLTQATLTVTANNTNRVYGATNPVFTASYNGFVNGDTVSVLSGSPSLTTAATTASPAGGYTIVTANGTLSATNYTFTFVNGTLTVTTAQVPVILSIGLTNKVVTVTWSSVAGVTYGLQSNTNLMGANWNNVLPTLTATGTTTSQTNAVGNAPQQFYRVTIVSGP